MFGDISDFFPFLFFGVFILIAIVAIVASFYFEKKRREGMRQVAEQLGLPFFEKGDPLLMNELAAFNLFSQGRSRKIKNMIHGDTAEVDLGIFDYQYTTGGGKNSTTWRQSVICFNSPQLNLPSFSMRPEGMFDKLGGALGFQDIDFDTHPLFSKSFVLKGEDEESIRQTFSTDILSHFENLKGVNVEGGGSRLIFFRPSKRIKPEEVHSFMEEGFTIYSLFRMENPPSA